MKCAVHLIQGFLCSKSNELKDLNSIIIGFPFWDSGKKAGKLSLSPDRSGNPPVPVFGTGD